MKVIKTIDDAVTKTMVKTKAALRYQAYDARNAQINKSKVSELITRQIICLPIYQQATTIMWYLHCRSEVKTLACVSTQLDQGKRIIVPFCSQDQAGVKQLGLWHLSKLDELLPGTWGILEPPQYRWQESEKTIAPEALDLVLVPGVAFDRNGARLGNGQGYYDRLLDQVRADTVLIGVGFQCQIVDAVPMADHDIYLDFVITEYNLYKGIGRKR